MIISNEEFRDALNNEKVKIVKYSCSENSLSGNSLEEEICGDTDLRKSHKIRLHAGFLIKTLSSNRWINPKLLFRNRDGIVDLRKAPDNIYNIQPGETIIMYTNEVVTLNSEYFGLLLPKVKDGESGLSISTSYVDPNWTGVLQLSVSNKSQSTQPIKERCEIANLVLMKTSKPITKLNETQCDHYALTWETISSDPEYPKWPNRKRNLFVKVRHYIKTSLLILVSAGVIGLVGIIDIIGKIIQYIGGIKIANDISGG